MQEIQIMIVGAQKSGTTSVLNYLAQHSKVTTHSNHTEMSFFSKEDSKLGYFPYAYDKYFKSFDKSEDNVIIAKDAVLMYSEEGVERLFRHNANMHIVMVLRDPVKRAYSAYWYARSTGRERAETFEIAIKQEREKTALNNHQWVDTKYIDNSLYVKHIKNILKHFPKEQLHVYTVNQLKKNNRVVIDEILNLSKLKFEENINLRVKYNEQKVANSKLLFLYQQFFLLLSKIKKILGLRLTFKWFTRLKQFLIEKSRKNGEIPKINKDTEKELYDFFKDYDDELMKLISKKES